MPLGKEVGLGPGHIVLDGDPVGTQRPHSSPSPLFSPCLLWPNRRPSQQLLSSCFWLSIRALVVRQLSSSNINDTLLHTVSLGTRVWPIEWLH